MSSLLDPRAVRDWCRQKFLSKENVLKTKETVEENEEEGKYVDALVIKEVFQSVGDGKSLIASAITGKGVNTDAMAAFSEMAENIWKIKAEGAVVGNGVDLSMLLLKYDSKKTDEFYKGASNNGGLEMSIQEVLS
jgi:hypothetical protein